MKFDRIEVSGLIVMFVGVILLALTFFSALGFLGGELTILASADLTELFGRALAPLVKAVIHILYLGVMGWVGSILTIRGVQLLKREKEATTTQPQVKTETKQSVPSTETKTETRTAPKPEPKPEVKEPVKAENPERAAEKARAPNPEPPKEPETKNEQHTLSEKTVEPIS